MKIKLLAFTILLFAAFGIVKSQEISATVTVNFEQIEPENRYNVATLERDIANYLNNQKFTKTTWEGSAIPVDIQIVLSGGNKNKFAAKMIISSRRIIQHQTDMQSVVLRMAEEKWSFIYQQGANLSFNPLRFDEITSVIDYYIYIIIGMDADSYGEMDGTRYFEQAKQIVQLGSNQGADGFTNTNVSSEYSKFMLVDELTDMRYEPFRKLMFSYYSEALDNLGKKREEALKNLAQVVSELADFKEKKLMGPSMTLKVFFDSKARELAELFKGYSDNQVFKNLIYLDPPNTNFYEASRDGK